MLNEIINNAEKQKEIYSALAASLVAAQKGIVIEESYPELHGFNRTLLSNNSGSHRRPTETASDRLLDLEDLYTEDDLIDKIRS